jgi:hypothetical protein
MAKLPCNFGDKLTKTGVKMPYKKTKDLLDIIIGRFKSIGFSKAVELKAVGLIDKTHLYYIFLPIDDFYEGLIIFSEHNKSYQIISGYKFDLSGGSRGIEIEGGIITSNAIMISNYEFILNAETSRKDFYRHFYSIDGKKYLGSIYDESSSKAGKLTPYKLFLETHCIN